MSKLLKVAAGLVALVTLAIPAFADEAREAESTTTATQLKVYYDTNATTVMGAPVNLTIVALKTDGSVAKDADSGGVSIRAAISTANGKVDADTASHVETGKGSGIVEQSSTTYTGVGSLYAEKSTNTRTVLSADGVATALLTVGDVVIPNTPAGYAYLITGITIDGSVKTSTNAIDGAGTTALSNALEAATTIGTTVTKNDATLNGGGVNDTVTATVIRIPQVPVNLATTADDNMYDDFLAGALTATQGQAADRSGNAIIPLIEGIGATNISYPTSLGSAAATDTVTVTLQTRYQSSGGGYVIANIGDAVSFDITVSPAAYTAAAFKTGANGAGGSPFTESGTDKLKSYTTGGVTTNADTDGVISAGMGQGYLSIVAYKADKSTKATFIGDVTVTFVNPKSNATHADDVTVTATMTQTDASTYSAVVNLANDKLKAAGIWKVNASATVNGVAVSSAEIATLTVYPLVHSATTPWSITAAYDRPVAAKYDFDSTTANPALPYLLVTVKDFYGNDVAYDVNGDGTRGDMGVFTTTGWTKDMFDGDNLVFDTKYTQTTSGTLATTTLTTVVGLPTAIPVKLDLSAQSAINLAISVGGSEGTKDQAVTGWTVGTAPTLVDYSAVATTVLDTDSGDAVVQNGEGHGDGALDVKLTIGMASNPGRADIDITQQIKVGYDHSQSSALYKADADALGVNNNTPGLPTGWAPMRATSNTVKLAADGTLTDAAYLVLKYDAGAPADPADDVNIIVVFDTGVDGVAPSTLPGQLGTNAAATNYVVAAATTDVTGYTVAQARALLSGIAGKPLIPAAGAGAISSAALIAGTGATKTFAEYFIVTEDTSANTVTFYPTGHPMILSTQNAALFTITALDTTTVAGTLAVTNAAATALNAAILPVAAASQLGFIDPPFADGKSITLDVYSSADIFKYSMTATTAGLSTTNESASIVANTGILRNLAFPQQIKSGDYAIVYPTDKTYGAVQLTLQDDNTNGAGTAITASGEGLGSYIAGFRTAGTGASNKTNVNLKTQEKVTAVSCALATEGYKAGTNGTDATIKIDTFSFLNGANATMDKTMVDQNAANGTTNAVKVKITSTLTSTTFEYQDFDDSWQTYSAANGVTLDTGDSDVGGNDTTLAKLQLKAIYAKADYGKADTLMITAELNGGSQFKTLTTTVGDVSNTISKINVVGQTTCPINGELLLKVYGADASDKVVNTTAAGTMVVKTISDGSALYDSRRGISTYGGNNGRFYANSDIGAIEYRLVTFKAPSQAGTASLTFGNNAGTVTTTYTITVEATTTAGAVLADGSGTDNTPVITITSAGSATSVLVAGTLQLTATTSNIEGTETYTWTTSDATKATVSTSGLVTGVAVGSAVITASGSTSGKTATFTVAVTETTATVTESLYCPFAYYAAGAGTVEVSIANFGTADLTDVVITTTDAKVTSATTVAAGARSKITLNTAVTNLSEACGFTLTYTTEAGTANVVAETQSIVDGMAVLSTPVTSAKTGNMANSFWFTGDGLFSLGAIMNTGSTAATFAVTIAGTTVAEVSSVAAGQIALFTTPAGAIGNVRIVPSSGATYVATSFTTNLSGIMATFGFNAGATTVVGGKQATGSLICVGASSSATTTVDGETINSSGLVFLPAGTTSDAMNTVTATAGTIVADELYLSATGIAIVGLPLTSSAVTAGGTVYLNSTDSSYALVYNAGATSATGAVVSLIGATATGSVDVGTLAAGEAKVVELTSSSVSDAAWSVSASGGDVRAMVFGTKSGVSYQSIGE